MRTIGYHWRDQRRSPYRPTVFQSTGLGVLFRSHPSGRSQMSNEPTPSCLHNGRSAPHCYRGRTPIIASTSNFETVVHSGFRRVSSFHCERYRKCCKITLEPRWAFCRLKLNKHRNAHRCQTLESVCMCEISKRTQGCATTDLALSPEVQGGT